MFFTRTTTRFFHAAFLTVCFMSSFLLVNIAHASFFDDNDQIIFSLSEQNPNISINSAYYFYSSKNLSPVQVLADDFEGSWQKLEKTYITPTENRTALWFTFQTSPAHAIPAGDSSSIASDYVTDPGWMLVLTWALLKHAQIHTFNHTTGEWWSSRPIGIEYPIAQRYRDSRQFIFPLSNADRDTLTIFLEIRSNNLLSFPASIMTEAEFDRVNELDTLFTGAVIGSLIVMFLYNLSLLGALKDKSYLYYCGFILSIIFYLLASTGLGVSYLWDNFTWLKPKAFQIFSSLTYISIVIFIREFLNLKQYDRWLIISNDFFLFLWVVMLAFTLVIDESWVLVILSVLALLSSFVGVLLAIYLTFQKNVEAKIFIFSWSVLIIGTFVFIAALYGALPFNIYTRYSQMLGIILELVLLSFALAYRINYDKKTREEAQQESLLLAQRVSSERRERLKAQIETLDTHKRMNDKLEHKVEMRTQQLEDAMNKLEGMNAMLTELSVTDPLTGIYNRRYFDDKLIAECKRAFRKKEPLAVIIADIDKFKPINDTFGHTVGDECIRQTAKALKTVIRRPSDLLARYGGEEFVFVLPGGNLEEALQVAENCRIAVETISFTHKQEAIHLTVSAGVAAWIPSDENGYKELLNAADSALYAAKKSGRNCIQASPEKIETA